MPGPVPKRSEQRRRANKPARDLLKPAGAAVEAPPLDLENIHPLAEQWYASLSSSPESRFFTPAVWQRARINALVLSGLLTSGRGVSSMLYASVQNDWKSLLVDPAEQRRLGIEVQAAAEDPDEAHADATVTSLMAKIGG